MHGVIRQLGSVGKDVSAGGRDVPWLHACIAFRSEICVTVQCSLCLTHMGVKQGSRFLELSAAEVAGPKISQPKRETERQKHTHGQGVHQNMDLEET